MTHMKKPKNQKTEQFVKELLKGIKAKRTEVLKDERSTDRYWNGDDWGSISGVRDAQEWVDNQITNYVVEQIENFKK